MNGINSNLSLRRGRLLYLSCFLSWEPKVTVGISHARLNSRALWPCAATEQPTARAAATFSPLAVGGLEPGGTEGRREVSGEVAGRLVDANLYYFLISAPSIHYGFSG